MKTSQKRRDFLKTSTAAAAGAVMPYWWTSPSAMADERRSANGQLLLGCIGTGSRWNSVGPAAMEFAECVALCDVDARHLQSAKDKVEGLQSKKGRSSKIETFEEYQRVLDRDDIDIVTIVTPDHWHSKIAIEAMQAGKDVYCEKPLTLTIQEGKQIIKVLEETDRVFQVGTQQRTEMGQRFLTAIAMIRDGRIGNVKRVICTIGGSTDSGEIPAVEPPKELNWEKWLGQAPLVDYRFKEDDDRRPKTRCHYEFRWWYEYSGGKMTDWGAHHVDIAQWAIHQNSAGQGPTSIEGWAKHPVPFENGYPTKNDRYNAATDFDVTCMFENGVEMHIVSDSSDGNGILFEGTQGRFHVSRGRMKGGPVEELESNPLPDGALEKVYGGPLPKNHMANFINCVKSRETPVSDVHSHHRAMTTCHLANIAIRLDRRIEWDPQSQQIVGDPEASNFVAREQRKGYEINVSV